jgi:hypothetical protein
MPGLRESQTSHPFVWTSARNRATIPARQHRAQSMSPALRQEIRMATKSRRTTLYSSKGKKLYAVRDKTGRFKDIQQYSRAHAMDMRRTSKDEVAKGASKKSARKSARKSAKKTAKKSARKTARKTVKKSTRKTAKKSARKTSRKVARKPARKTAKKTARKTARKSARTSGARRTAKKA